MKVFKAILGLTLVVVALGCTTNKTTTITGPFGPCTTLILPDGSTVTGSPSTSPGSTVTIGGITYTITSDCHTEQNTSTVTTPVVEQPKPGQPS